jgi:hypothetical protein
VTFERSIDYKLIREILTADPRSYDAMSDDASPSIAEFEPNQHPAIWYVVVRSAEEPIGLFTFIPQNAVCYEAHTCMLRAAWGREALTAGRGVIGWMFEHSPCRRIVGATPAYLRLAVRFAESSGMVEYGRNPKAFLKNAILHDLILTGISA